MSPSALPGIASVGPAGAVAPSQWCVPVIPHLGLTMVQGTWVRGVDSSAYLCGYIYNSTDAQNDEITWPVVLAAGTYTLEVIYFTGSNKGIATFRLDGNSIGTIDMYAAGGGAANVFGTITGIVVAADGKKTFGVKMATKNASASAYRGLICVMNFARTA